MERIESRAHLELPLIYETPHLLDGFREHTKYGSGCVGNHTQENKTARFRVVQDCRFVEGHYPVREIREGEGGGFQDRAAPLAEALEKQDLFINSTLAQLGCNILWKMFRNGMLEHHGLFLNLETMKVNPIMI